MCLILTNLSAGTFTAWRAQSRKPFRTQPKDQTNWEFRLCKYPVALVEWDPIFEYADCHVPLNPNKYNKEDEYCGWNMLNKDYLRQLREVQTAEAEVDEDLRPQVDAANAVLDVTMEAACAGCS